MARFKSPDKLPKRSGVYQTIDAADDGSMSGDTLFSYFDATDRIWGCSSDDHDMAALKPDFEFARQQKWWK